MKLCKSLIIPLLLVIGYVILVSYPYFFSKINRFYSLGFFSLVEEKSLNLEKTYSPNRVIDELDNHLLSGEKISGKIKATENNFGILLFRFARLSAKVSDSVTFRIKEEKEEKWYYEKNYTADQFQPDEYFTFGFPSIKNSRGKTYIFEILSLSGTYTNGIGTSLKKPQVAMVYKFTKADLKDVTLFTFIVKKLTYVVNNLHIWEYLNLLIISLSIYILIYFTFTKTKKITFSWTMFESLLKRQSHTIKSKYFLWKTTIVKFSMKLKRKFMATRFYYVFLNTQMKKRLAISLLLFLIALLYRFSQASVERLGINSFYSGLGGQGDYDQFIRAAACALKLCPAILGQNFLFESSILGIFYGIFGFTGGLRAYLYLMIILSSIVAILPYLLLSRKNWMTIGGIIGSLFLANSDYLTNAAISLPPDNGSLFTFSMFYIVYLFTMQYGTIRWLLFFGLMGTIDGLNKLTFLLNDLAALVIFIPAFFFEKSKKIKTFPFITLNIKLVFYSLLPFLLFSVIYWTWEYFVQITYSVPYYLRELIETRGRDYMVTTSFSESLAAGNMLARAYYYAASTFVMLERIAETVDLNGLFLTPILLGLLFSTLRNSKYFITKLLSIVIFSGIVFTLLALFRSNYLGIQNISAYSSLWSNSMYVSIFLMVVILFLFLLHFRFHALLLSLPIIPYVIMLIILTKNAPWIRLLVHVIVWSIILFSFIIDETLTNTKKQYALKKLLIGPTILILFIFFYTVPKQVSMTGKLYSNMYTYVAEVTYLRWVNSELPRNAILLGGGKSDLVAIAENVHRPIIYNSLWRAALLIKPKEIPGIKPTDFAILNQLKITQIPGISASDFSIVEELRNENNFTKKKYIILEDDISLWRSRMAGIVDSLFSSSSAVLLHGDDYSVKVYKFNSALNKGIYELKLRRD